MTLLPFFHLSPSLRSTEEATGSPAVPPPLPRPRRRPTPSLPRPRRRHAREVSELGHDDDVRSARPRTRRTPEKALNTSAPSSSAPRFRKPVHWMHERTMDIATEVGEQVRSVVGAELNIWRRKECY
ncbi:hypothetical protein PVAP13_6NG149060 [Panicum virgatum]|uniref:Uncharacterized protein n=1 Tax=Panicum virgatum TaxID=38727 RepID=A0A8T0QUT7_PANVG|nr:hypothetical protein PVAP13_6NG149060 [Panicum virgatum]